jgi:hypothetical protein
MTIRTTKTLRPPRESRSQYTEDPPEDAVCDEEHGQEQQQRDRQERRL